MNLQRKYLNIFNSKKWNDNYNRRFDGFTNIIKRKIVKELLRGGLKIPVSDYAEVPVFESKENDIYYKNGRKMEKGEDGKWYLNSDIVDILKNRLSFYINNQQMKSVPTPNERKTQLKKEKGELINEDEIDEEDYGEPKKISDDKAPCAIYEFDECHTYGDILKKEAENDGNCSFVDKKIRERPIKIPIVDISTLQTTIVIISSEPVSFSTKFINQYICSECGNEFNFPAYLTESTKGRKVCNGTLETGRTCKKVLSPSDSFGDTNTLYYYRCNACDGERSQPIYVVSGEYIHPNVYRMSLVTYPIEGEHNHFRAIFAVPYSTKTFKDVINEYNKDKNPHEKIIVPEEGDNEVVPCNNIHPIFHFIRLFDHFILERTNEHVVGMTLPKVALFLQYLGKLTKTTNRIHIHIGSGKGFGKSYLLELWCKLFYPARFLKTGGEGLSAPTLRGTAKLEKDYIMGKEYSVKDKGALYNFDMIFIDEFNHLDYLSRLTLKETLWANAFINSKSDNKDKELLERKASVVAAENPSGKHLRDYHTRVRQYYNDKDAEFVDYSDLDDEIGERPGWKADWDLFQPIGVYQENPWLKRAIEEARTYYRSTDTHWMDGHWDALHDRFIINFFLTSDKNDDARNNIVMNEVFDRFTRKHNSDLPSHELKVNRLAENISLFTTDMSDIFLQYQKYLDTTKKEHKKCKNRIWNLFFKYNVNPNDYVRMGETYASIAHLIRMTRKSYTFIEEDFQVLERFFRLYGRAVTLNEIESEEFLSYEDYDEFMRKKRDDYIETIKHKDYKTPTGITDFNSEPFDIEIEDNNMEDKYDDVFDKFR